MDEPLETDRSMRVHAPVFFGARFIRIRRRGTLGAWLTGRRA